MSQFNVETAFSDLMKRVAALTAKIVAQSAVIDSQNKKIEDQQQVITEQTRVLADLSSNIKKIEVHIASMNTSKSEMEKPVVIPSTQRTSETKVGIDAKEPHEMVSERTRRATERAKNKAASILQKTADKSENAETGLEDNTASEEWKVVGGNKKRPKTITNTIQRGGNSQIVALQAIQRKKFLHVWSLHPDTTEKAISELCESADIKVEKIIPKTVRDYASFMVGVPESLFEKVNNVDSWPLNAQFNQWVWFRNSRNPAKGNQSQL